ncbi:uncharacterized protein EDB93DRAFT_1127808 [Suillus bovinus]|uniref:uncharacterized protein n=1 Tax=Suillus bovinus TaxID=48563 RepID=UPI001B880D48|nr:uncharacterized protein EDB93DRAFT_1127808 [Suillus bovinus]KAG2156663.1 hypothetical protein EDB93DRAFT_1127808 [Suillus bovinus]
MSSARHWFSKRITTPKSPTSNDFCRSATEKLPENSMQSDSFKFSPFASVIGRKSKKSRPTLAIPDSPLPSLVSPPAVYSNPDRYTNRPPAKSISSTIRSGDDSFEPRTPPDVQADRVSFPRSVLTLSDPDPFASGGISVPRNILDQGSVSVYSNNTSAHDVVSNKDQVDFLQHPSHLSMSSQSHSDSRNATPSLEFTGPYLSPMADSRGTSPREMFKRNEIIDDQKNLESPVYCSPLDIHSKPSLSKHGSAVTLTDQSHKGPQDFPAVAVRSTMYRRGYAAPSPFQAASTVSQPRKGSSSPSAEVYVRSRTLSRQQSTSRPAPACELPPPPTMSHVTSVPAADGAEDKFPLSADGSSSSGISCPSPTWRIQELDINDPRPYKGINLGFDHDFGTQHQPVKESNRIHVRDTAESTPPPLAFHQLKKSMSHSTLQKAKSGSGGTQESFKGDKGLKKQHSFHRSRAHTPPTSTPASPSTPSDHDPSSAENRIPPLPHPHAVVRKRMFSGSRKSSTAMTDEDLRSVFSLPTEAGRSHLASPRTVVSLLDEPSDPLASDIIYPTADFTPQYIMSPAEMLKMEAIVQGEFDAKYGEALRNPQRATFASTPMYGTMYRKEGLKTTLSSFPHLAPTRSASNVSKGLNPRSFTRPSTAHTTSSSTLQSSSTKASLSPPQRPRARPHTAETMYHEDLFSRRSSNVPFIPLSPPPRRPKCAIAIHTPSLVGNTAVPQRSVIRKPSFLEIADDTDCCEGSFLDFDSGKESFDFSRDFD